MKAVIYARVSTTGQDASLQTWEMRQFTEARGWTMADEYIDAGISGAKDSRPELNRLMADAHKRRFDVVLVWKLDRFGRSLRHLVNALAEFESLGIAFVSLSDNLDLSTASGRLMFNIIGAIAEFERALIQEWVKAGIRNARAKGKQIGRLRANVDAAQIAQLRAQGLSWKKIAKQMGWESGLSTASLRRTSLLANHIEVGGRNRHRATFFGHVAGEFNLVAQVRHEFCVVVRGEVSRNGVNLAVRSQYAAYTRAGPTPPAFHGIRRHSPALWTFGLIDA